VGNGPGPSKLARLLPLARGGGGGGGAALVPSFLSAPVFRPGRPISTLCTLPGLRTLEFRAGGGGGGDVLGIASLPPWLRPRPIGISPPELLFKGVNPSPAGIESPSLSNELELEGDVIVLCGGLVYELPALALCGRRGGGGAGAEMLTRKLSAREWLDSKEDLLGALSSVLAGATALALLSLRPCRLGGGAAGFRDSVLCDSERGREALVMYSGTLPAAS
jgi:hypothetical protein